MNNSNKTYPEILAEVSADGLLLAKYVEYQNRITHSLADQLAEAAVENNGLALEFVVNKTPALQQIAVYNTGHALKFCKNPGEATISAALMNTGMALRYVEDKTQLWCDVAVGNTMFAFRHVPAEFQTMEMCTAVLNAHPEMIEDVAVPSTEVCEIAVKTDPRSLRYVKNQTEELCMLALTRSTNAFLGIQTQTPSLIEYALTKNPELIEHVTDPSLHWSAFAAMITLRKLLAKLPQEHAEKIRDALQPLVDDDLLNT